MLPGERNSYLIKSIILLFFTLESCQYASERENLSDIPEVATVISINNIAVSKAEYLLHLKPEIALTYNHFYLTHGAEPSKDFWTKSWDGLRPLDYIKNQTDDNLTRIKIIQQLAAKINLVHSFDYDVFLRDWKKSNQERRARELEGEVVYGPIEVGKRDYYDYLFSNLEIRLKEKLNQDIFVPSPETLRDHYKLMKHDHFEYSPAVTLECLMLNEHRLTVSEVDQMIRNFKISLEGGESMVGHASRIPAWTYKKLTIFDSVPAHGEENAIARLKERALKLRKGEVAVVRVDYQSYMIRLLHPFQSKFRDYEKVKDQVLFDYQSQRYNELVRREIGFATIEKNEDIYDKISIK